MSHLLNLEPSDADADFAWRGPRIASWEQFHRVVKRPGRPLLARLGDFADSVLVSGCQRSGTTALTRLLRAGKGMADFRFCRDDELAGALLLAGHVESARPGRYCFQTTYLNDRVGEYFDHDGFRLIWIIREPTAVIRSMLHNWKRGALRRLYAACGRYYAAAVCTDRHPLLSLAGPTRLEQACASYLAKTRQAFDLRERLGERMLIVDYDDMVAHKQTLLPEIFDFAAIDADPDCLERLQKRNIGTGEQFPPRVANRIRRTCGPIYERIRRLRTIGADDA